MTHDNFFLMETPYNSIFDISIKILKSIKKHCNRNPMKINLYKNKILDDYPYLIRNKVNKIKKNSYINYNIYFFKKRW